MGFFTALRRHRRTPTEPESTAPDAGPLFPIDRAEEHLRKAFPDLERDDHTLRWPDHDGHTDLAVTRIDYRTPDNLLVREQVTLTHTTPLLDAASNLFADSISCEAVPDASPTARDRQHLAAVYADAINRCATLSALLPADSSHSAARLVSRVGIFADDRAAAENVYASLICMEASVIGWHAAMLARGQFHLDPDRSPLLEVSDPPSYDAADFEIAKHFTDRFGYLASLGSGYFCVEFPWTHGAVSNQFASPAVREKLLTSGRYTEEDLDRLAGRTSLLQITTNERHGLYGRGVLCRLELPLPINTPNDAHLVDELNRWELSGPDLPPQFGAWCIGPRAPTFVTFTPNQYCVPGLLENLTVWAHARHGRVRDWLTASSTRN